MTSSSVLSIVLASVLCSVAGLHLTHPQPIRQLLSDKSDNKPNLSTSSNHFENVNMSTPRIVTPVLMTTDDYNALPDIRGDETHAYVEGGENTDQYGELYLPKDLSEHTHGSVPVVLLLHGGCWLQTYDRHGASSMAAAIASEVGYIVYAITYRRLPEIPDKPCCGGCAGTGDCEGDTPEKEKEEHKPECDTKGSENAGWSSDTFEDVAHATAELTKIQEKYPQMDLDNVIGMGHSAGGHLALWAASRSTSKRVQSSTQSSKEGHRGSNQEAANITTNLSDNIAAQQHELDRIDAIFPVEFKAVVSLAGIADLRDATCKEVCGTGIPRLMGGRYGTSEAVDMRYNWASPMENVPLGVQQVLIHGAVDQFVPSTLNDQYFTKANQAGDNITQHFVHGAGHFEVVVPEGESWSLVQYVLKSLGSNQD